VECVHGHIHRKTDDISKATFLIQEYQKYNYLFLNTMIDFPDAEYILYPLV